MTVLINSTYFLHVAVISNIPAGEHAFRIVRLHFILDDIIYTIGA